MNRLLICCLFFLCLSSQRLLAEEFIVTSSLPTGEGSLREALEKAAANGNRETDYIRFNVTRARDPLIVISPNSLLPALSDNLIIDGTSQPGAFLGVSQAKIGVALEGLYGGTDPLYLFDARKVRNVKIFGLFMKGNVVIRTTGARPAFFTAVYLQQSQNIQIGGPDAGNVISGWTRAVYEHYDGRAPVTSSVTISSNIFGLDPDGKSTVFQDRTKLSAINTFSVVFEKNLQGVQIGGANADAGNIFCSSNTDVVVEGTKNSDSRVTISHNKFGIDFFDNNIDVQSAVAISMSSINTFPLNPLPASPVITDNYIGGKGRTTGILGRDLESNFQVLDNILGFEDRTGSPDRDANYGVGIHIQGAFQGKIIGNTIRYWKQGAVICDATYTIQISKNSTYCNRKRAIELRNWNVLSPPTRKQPFAYINRIDVFRDIVSGTALPDNVIELFYNKNCPTCEGRQYFATVQSDAQGNWTYNGPLESDSVIATATEIFQATSEYSMPKIDQAGVVISPVTCAGGTGSICGLKILSGTKWRWEDENGNVVGNDTCLRSVPAGRYFFKVSLGGSCEEIFPFTIRDVSPAIDASRVTIASARCGLANGSVCGIRVQNGVRQTWEDEFGNAVSTSLCFNNARPGRYRLKLEGQQSCLVYSAFFEVPNKVPRIDAVNATVVHPSCGRDNGSISGIQLFDMEFSTRGWYNEAGALISSSLDLRNAAPGKYKLVVKDNTGACGDSTTYFTLNIVPAPGMNTSSAQVADASCGRTDGSIRGITLSNITGTASYWWVNGSGAVVATTADLLNVGPGSYRLKVRDGSNCDTLFSPVYNIADRGSVSLDETMLTVTPTGCTKVAGAIKGIRISGANSLEWRNTVTGVVVGNTADIIGLPAGSYQLTAVNTTYGCSLKSGVYIVQVAPPLDLKVLADEVENASCGLNNGLIRLLQFNNNESYFTFRWLRDSITPVGTSLSLTNLPPATYYAIATDTNGCDIPFYKKTITALALPRLNEAAAAVTADTCQFTTGSISGLVATSDEPGLQYSWRTLTDQPVGDGPQLNNVTAGDYYLLVTDARGCSVRSRNYNVPSINATLAAPRYTASFDIARNSSLSFSPAAGARAGTYSLYDRATGALLAENTTGSFSLAAIAVDRELYVVFSAGPCTSREAVIRIKVYDETKLTIPNAFSPNGDGINDAFRVQVIGLFHLRSMKIFNRYGQMVHEIRDLNQPWDGKRNGTPLPVGTYYWLIDGFDMHNRPLKQSGSITLIR